MGRMARHSGAEEEERGGGGGGGGGAVEMGHAVGVVPSSFSLYSSLPPLITSREVA